MYLKFKRSSRPTIENTHIQMNWTRWTFALCAKCHSKWLCAINEKYARDWDEDLFIHSHSLKTNDVGIIEFMCWRMCDCDCVLVRIFFLSTHIGKYCFFFSQVSHVYFFYKFREINKNPKTIKHILDDTRTKKHYHFKWLKIKSES